MKNKLAVQSFILTIGSIVVSLLVKAAAFFAFVSVIATIVGFITGIVALRQIKRTNQSGKVLAITSIVISGIMLVLMIFASIVITYFIIYPPVH